MVVSASIESKTLYLFFEGELDSSAANGLRERIDEYIEKCRINKIVFDFSKLTFMDSTGIGLILGRYKRLKGRGVALSIYKPQQQIKKVLHISGIDTIIPIIE